MASGSHVCSGTCAALAHAAIRRKTKTQFRNPGGNAAECRKSKEPVRAKRIRMANSRNALPTCVISMALNPARKLRSS